MFSVLQKILGSPNERKVKAMMPVVEHINDLESEMQKLDDEALRAKTAEFKQILSERQTSDDEKQDYKYEQETLEFLLPDAFAVVREAARRTLGLRHYDVQLMGGMVLHQGGITEMRTGEGKTLVATLPAYLNALAGKGVHVVTVNDYLAKRDAEWMGQVYRFLGLSVGTVLSTQRGNDLYTQKRLAYAADITYGTNNEFGFDYLRDNMASSLPQLVQRGQYYAIVDEVDSILIDEARTPLIISGRLQKSADLYVTMAKVAPMLTKEEHYTVDEKARNVILTEDGIDKAQDILGVEDLFDPRINFAHHLLQALKAKELYLKDVDYVINHKGEVVIVDEFTGRLMEGRRWSDGLHQAVEAKEGCSIQDETQTLASITFQNLFRLYPKLAGMTGTALTEAAEFSKIYNLEVTAIPANRGTVRDDLPDEVYKNERAKFKAIVAEVKKMHSEGRPVLVGTVSIDKSESLSKLLAKEKITHSVLNAKQHEQEAAIIAQAGRKGAVTIATNMAGRGTDILLGGNPEFLAKDRLHAKGVHPESVTAEYLQDFTEDTRKITEAEKAEVIALGGLHIIGSERHESRRIDNQLRGRAGRQGDPGSSRFYLALDDSLMRLFGGDKIASMMEMLNVDEDTAINAGMVTPAIERAQKRVESYHFDIRKSVLRFDDVLTEQRELIYTQRRRVLEGKGLRESIVHMIGLEMERLLASYISASMSPNDWPEEEVKEFVAELHMRVPQIAEIITLESIKGQSYAELLEWVQAEALSAYEQIEAHLADMAKRLKADFDVDLEGIEGTIDPADAHPLRRVEREILLQVVDARWIDHLQSLDHLRENIGLRAYGQKDPLIEYKREAYELFQQLTYDIQRETVTLLFRSRVEVQLENQLQEFNEQATAEA